MGKSIKEYVKDNFKNTTKEEIKESIEASIKEQDEVLLPGLGVLFEILWSNSSLETKDEILNILKNNL